MYQKVLCLDPDDFDGHYNLASILTRKERHGEAQEHYKKVLELQPSDAYQVLNCYGYSYFLQGEFVKARTELEKSIYLNGKYLDAYCNMSLVLFCEGKSEDAVKYFEDGMKILDKEQNTMESIQALMKGYIDEKGRLEMKLDKNEEIMDKGKIKVLRAMIHGFKKILNLLKL